MHQVVASWPLHSLSPKKFLCTVIAFCRRATFTPSTQFSTRARIITPTPVRQEYPVKSGGFLYAVIVYIWENLQMLWWQKTNMKDDRQFRPYQYVGMNKDTDQTHICLLPLQNNLNQTENICICNSMFAFVFLLLWTVCCVKRLCTSAACVSHIRALKCFMLLYYMSPFLNIIPAAWKKKILKRKMFLCEYSIRQVIGTQW